MTALKNGSSLHPATTPGHLTPRLVARHREEEQGSVLVAPRYGPRGVRIARLLRLPTLRRVVLDADGSRVVRLIDGERSITEIATRLGAESSAEQRRLMVFLARLAAGGLVAFHDPRTQPREPRWRESS